MKNYVFIGHEDAAEVKAVNTIYESIGTAVDLYDALDDGIWTVDTCAPRLREKWSMDNKTVGQCSITAFLAQDIFGGEVYGVPLPEGGVHCFNIVGDRLFDLASEQFGEEAFSLKYTKDYPQSREEHFADADKKARYEMLKTGLNAR